MTISLHLSRSLRTVCRCRLMTHSGGLSGALSVSLVTILGLDTRTSVLHQLSAVDTASAPCISYHSYVRKQVRQLFMTSYTHVVL